MTMNVKTASCTSFPVTVVLAGLSLALASSALPSQTGNNQKTRLSNNGTAICPNGWIPSAASNYDVTHQKLCVRVQERILTWDKARQDCRASRGFLIKLDAVLSVDDVRLNEYLKTRGLDTVWTGMHHEHGTLLWDELQPHMVKAFYGNAQTSGWKKRDWKFNFDSFKLSANTCGKFEVQDSLEISEDHAANRTKRSPPRPLGNLRLRVGLAKGRRIGGDNEEVAPSRAPVEDKKIDSLQSSLSQGLQEGFSDHVGDTSNIGDTNTAGKSDTFSRAGKTPERTTLRTITMTDQSNLEDVDDFLLATKRSSQHPNIKGSVTSATTIPGNSSVTSLNTTQTNANSSLLSTATSHTTSTPRPSTSVDDLLNRLLKSSLDSSPNSDVSGSVDTSSNSERLDPTVTSGNDSVERPAIEHALLVDSQSGSKDISDDMTPRNTSLINSNSVDLTDTSDSHSAATPIGVTINATSFFKTTTSIESATETPNLVQDSDDSQNTISAKMDTIPQFVTPRSTTSHFLSVIKNIFSNKPTMTTRFPTTTSSGSLAKDSHNIDDASQDFVTSKSVTNRLKSFSGKLLSERATTTESIPVIIPPGLLTSTVRTTTRLPTSNVVTTRLPTSIVVTTRLPTSTVIRTASTFVSNKDFVKSHSLTNHSTSSNSNLSPTQQTTVKNTDIMTSLSIPASTDAVTRKTPTASFTANRDAETTNNTTNSMKNSTGKVFSKRSTTNSPVIITNLPMSTVTTHHLSTFTSNEDIVNTTMSVPNNSDSFTGKVFLKRPTTTHISVFGTTDLPMSNVATTTRLTFTAKQDVIISKSAPVLAKPLIGKLVSKRSTTTTNIPVMTTTDLPTSTVATTTRLTTFTANKDFITSKSAPDLAEPLIGKLVSKRSTTTTNIPVMTTTDLPTSTVATTTRLTTFTANKDFITSKSAPDLAEPLIGKLVSKRSTTTTNIPVMTTTDLPTSTVATTAPSTSFNTQPNLTTSSVVTAQSGFQNASTANTTSTSSSTTASSVQVALTETPTFINTAENTTTARLVTNMTSQVDGTAHSALVSTSLSDETQKSTNTTNIPPLTIDSTSSLESTFTSKTLGIDDSSEVTDDANSTHNNSTATVAPGILTTPGIIDPVDQNSKETDLDSVGNATEVVGSFDLYVNQTSNATGNDVNIMKPKLDLLSPTNPEASDDAVNITSIAKQLLGNVSGSRDLTGRTSDKVSSAKVDTTENNDSPEISAESKDSTQRDSSASKDSTQRDSTASKDSTQRESTASKDSTQRDSSASKDQDVSDDSGGSSLSTDDIPRDTTVRAPSDTVSLSPCEEEHASVCVTEAVEELSLVGHCDRNWYGHRLLDRCYKPIEFTLKAIEARQNCLHYSASLATVDTGFYGNITALLLGYFAPGTRVWVDASLNLEVSDDGQCGALEDGQFYSVDCNLRLPFICQKDVRFYAPYGEDGQVAKSPVIYVQNLTSFHPQTLWCPLRMSAFDDAILWFKDGRPIINQDDDDVISFRTANGHMPNRLDIDLSILEHLGEGGARIPKPAMLQGLYWCEIFRREPFNRVVSYKIFLKFTDVITLYGHITTVPANHVTAAIFNRMGHVIGLPALMERRLATLNKNITHFMRTAFPIVRDIITFTQRTNPDTGRSEFTTYICLATGDLGSRVRGSLVDLYLSAFYDALVKTEDELQKEWSLTLPVRQAVALTMADMCPEANLIDKSTRLSATFPSTTVNNFAVSRDMCNGAPIGSAFCKGDLQSGAYWDMWKVANPCNNFIQQTLANQPVGIGTRSSIGPHRLDESKNNRAGLDREFATEKPAQPDLVKLNQVNVNKDNIAEVSDRLADVVNDAGSLSASDIENIAQVVHRIVSVDKLTSEISDKLVSTANCVLDAPETELRKAEQHSNAPSRLLADLEKFGEKADMGVESWVRFVTPNVAMEMWNLQDSSDVVIGFGATQAFSWITPLSEPRIQTIKDRMWAEQHLSSFDVAIQLPESLVKNTVQYSESSLRLTMFIYRKTGLFVGSRGTDSVRGAVNSAIISASLGGRRISGLEDKVRLVFKPFQEPKDGHKSTQCVFWDTELKSSTKWSTSGCVYNGTINGRTACLCDHLTNFAILTDFYGDRSPISKGDETALTVLTIIGLILSIIGLGITIITFLAFKKLRQGRAQQTLFNMSVALLCFQTTFLIGVKQTSVMPVCLIVSILLHYFILVSFAWMLIEAVLQYLTFVKVLGTYVSRYTLKTVIPAWGLPLLPVTAVLATDYRLYLGRAHYCWMDLQAYYYAFALPVGIIIVFNIVMFFIIIMSLATKPKGLRSNQTNNSARKTSLKAAITIFVLLGLTWIFGYLAIEDARLPFQYAFTILSSLQGFLIFLLMVARRKQVRDHWEIMCCLKWKRKQNKQKKLSPTFSTSTTCSSSNSHNLHSFANDSITLSSSTGSRNSSSSLRV